jgi:hypothetical protein
MDLPNYIDSTDIKNLCFSVMRSLYFSEGDFIKRDLANLQQSLFESLDQLLNWNVYIETSSEVDIINK